MTIVKTSQSFHLISIPLPLSQTADSNTLPLQHHCSRKRPSGEEEQAKSKEIQEYLVRCVTPREEQQKTDAKENVRRANP